MIKKIIARNRVLVTPGSGHGTAAIYHAVGGVHAPDAPHIFGWNYDSRDLPGRDAIPHFKVASGGFDLNLTETIAENLMRVVREKDRKWVLLRGFASFQSPFLTENGLKALGLVRNPVDAAVALLLERHPEIISGFHGGSAEAAFRWYGKLWHNVVFDLFESGSDVVWYEEMPEAFIGCELYDQVASAWRPPEAGFGLSRLQPELAAALLDEVEPMLEKVNIEKWM